MKLKSIQDDSDMIMIVAENGTTHGPVHYTAFSGAMPEDSVAYREWVTHTDDNLDFVILERAEYNALVSEIEALRDRVADLEDKPEWQVRYSRGVTL